MRHPRRALRQQQQGLTGSSAAATVRGEWGWVQLGLNDTPALFFLEAYQHTMPSVLQAHTPAQVVVCSLAPLQQGFGGWVGKLIAGPQTARQHLRAGGAQLRVAPLAAWGL